VGFVDKLLLFFRFPRDWEGPQLQRQRECQPGITIGLSLVRQRFVLLVFRCHFLEDRRGDPAFCLSDPVRVIWAIVSLRGPLEDQVEVFAPTCASILGCVPTSVDAVRADMGHEALVEVGILAMQGPLVSGEGHME